MKAEPDMSVVLTDLVVDLGAAFLRAWGLMLLFGVLHASAHSVPAFGYWQSFFAVVILESIVAGGAFQISRRVQSLTPMYGKKSPTTDAVRDLITKLNKVGKAGTN